MVKTCGNCVYMLDDGDGSKPYCARRDLYYNVHPEQKGCADWRSNENKLECGLARYHAELMKGVNHGNKERKNKCISSARSIGVVGTTGK